MCCCDKSKTETKPKTSSCCGGPTAASMTETDPVCGMKVDVATAAQEAHGGRTFHFCCEGCATKFHDAPQKYLQARENVAGS